MKRFSLLLLSCIMTFSTVALSSCANRIPSMYMDVNAPKPQIGDVSQYDEQSDETEEVSDEQYSSLTDNISVTPSKSENKTVSRGPISSPTMYSGYVPSSPSSTSSTPSTPSTPSSTPSTPSTSSTSSTPSSPSSTPSSDPSSAPSQLGPNEIPTTGYNGTEVDIEDSLNNKFIALLDLNYNITDSFEYDTDTKDAQMSIIVTMCEYKLKTDSDSGVQYFTKEDIENTYKNYFGTAISNPSELTSKSGVKYADGKYELVDMPEKTTHTKYARSALSLGNGYYKILADIRSGGSVIATAVYVVKENASSPYGANLIAQKITKL